MILKYLIPVGRSFSPWSKSCSETCFCEQLEAFFELKARTFMWVPCRKTTRNYPARFLNCSTQPAKRLNWRIFALNCFKPFHNRGDKSKLLLTILFVGSEKNYYSPRQKIVHCFVSNISVLFFLSHELLMSLICYCPSTFTCMPEWTFIRKLPFQQKLSGNRIKFKLRGKILIE